MPPNLLAHNLYLGETTVVRQAIETARTSVSSGGHSSSYWCQQRHHISCGGAMQRPLGRCEMPRAGSTIPAFRRDEHIVPSADILRSNMQRACDLQIGLKNGV